MRSSRGRRRCARLPYLNFDNTRFPIKGGLLQARAVTARHDGVAWGNARGADSLRLCLPEGEPRGRTSRAVIPRVGRPPWLVVTRNTLPHEILGPELASDVAMARKGAAK